MAIVVGSVAVDVVPDASRFASTLRAKLLPEATKVGDDVGKTVSDRISANVRDALPKALGEGARGAGAAGGRAGDDFGGSFARTAKARIEAALRNLPKPQVGVNATELDAKLAEIRAKMQALADVRIGVDLNAAEAMAEIDRLRIDLAVLGSRSPDINVRVDAAKAAAELAAIQAEVDRLDGRDVNIDVNDHGSAASAEAGLGALMTTGIALGPAIIPVAAAVAAAVAGIGAGAVAGIAGLATLALAFHGISGAVKELTDGQTKSASTAASAAARQVSAAASIANAEQSVADAHRAVGDAERQATQSVQAAIARQQDAEMSLTRAQRDATQAQKDLSAARQQAKQDLEDLTIAVKDGALQQRQANLAVQEARQNLNKVMADPRSTNLQREQAKLAYDEAVQQVDDIAVRQKRLQDQLAAASKAGVNGSQVVQQAQQRVVDTQDALTRAQRNEQQAAAAVVEARRAGAEAILQANERVISAERQLAVAHAQAGAAGVAASNATATAMSRLSPQGQAFARFIAGSLIPLFHQIQSAAQGGLLPGLQAGLQAMLPIMPVIVRLVGAVATAMGDLFAAAGKALGGPFWTQFFQFLASTMGPNLQILGTIIGNVATAFAGLFQAFAPVSTQVGKGLAELTGKFAAFTTGGGLQKFVGYVHEVGPKVASALGSVFRAIGHIVAALAPLGVIALRVIGAIADVITKIPTKDLTDLIAAIIGVVVAMQAVGIVMAVVSAGPVALIIAGIALLVVGLILAYNHSKTFRDIVSASLHWVAGAAKYMGDVFVAIWHLIDGAIHGIIGLFHAMRDVSVAVVNGITGGWNAVVGFFTGLRGRFDRATSGMWDGIKVAFKAVINTVISMWDGFVAYLKIPGFDVGVPHTPIHYHFGGLDIGAGLQIPLLAQGGVATAATLGVFGERGREAILPLDDPRSLAMIRSALFGGGGGAQGGVHIDNLNVMSPADPAAIGRSVPQGLRRELYVRGVAW